MSDIHEISAAPHLPYALRQRSHGTLDIRFLPIAQGVRMVVRDGNVAIEIDADNDRIT